MVAIENKNELCHICGNKDITARIKQESLTEIYLLPAYELCADHQELLGRFMEFLMRNTHITIKNPAKLFADEGKPAVDYNDMKKHIKTSRNAIKPDKPITPKQHVGDK